jgi:quercetin dioxygenase-like cupin family protein
MERKKGSSLNLQKAREVVDRMYTSVAQDLAHTPHMEKMRRSLLAPRDDVFILMQTEGGTTMSRKILKGMLAGVLVVFAVGAIALKVAWATPPKGFVQTLIAGPVALDEMHVVSETPAHGVQIKTRGFSDAYIVQNTIAPRGDTGWHSHRGPVFVLVTAGTATAYQADDPTHTPTVFTAGTGFLDGVDDTHIVRNEGDTDLELCALFLVPKGAPRRIDESQPPGYPF